MGTLGCEIAPLGSLAPYRYAVVLSKYEGKWLLCRHRDRETWEFPGGHIEEGESPLEAARRELWEESGAQEYRIQPLFDYRPAGGQGEGIDPSSGMVFFAEIQELGPLPDFEMTRVECFSVLPRELTYVVFQGAMARWLEEHPEYENSSETGHDRAGVLQACLPNGWTAAPAQERDCPEILELYLSNPAYMALEQEEPSTLQNVRNDIQELPPGIPPERKHYLCLRRNGLLAAVLDFAVGYPDEGTAFLGLFKVHGEFHRRGIGRLLMKAFWESLALGGGIEKVRLAVIEENRPGLAFWAGQGFTEVSRTASKGEGHRDWSLIIMERKI